jgi:hypothetical protein
VTARDDTIVRFDGHSWKPVTGSPAGLTGYGVTAFKANDVWVTAQTQEAASLVVGGYTVGTTGGSAVIWAYGSI